MFRNVPCWSLAGYQRIVKGHYRSGGARELASTAAESQYVVIFLVVFRLEGKRTDIVISLNVPLNQAADIEAIHNPDINAVLNWIDTAPGLSEAGRALKEIVANFEIIDWSLFDANEGDD